MVSNNEQPHNPQTESATELSTKKTDPACKKRKLIPMLSPIIACGAILAALYNYQTSTEMQQRLLKKNQEFAQELKQLQAQQEAQQDSITQQLTQLNQKTQQALRDNTSQSQDWLLLKARYYLELAQINAHWSRDPQSTIELLQQSDILLMQMHDPNLFNIRQVIAQELTQLKERQPQDLVGLLSQLDAVHTGITQLSIPTPNFVDLKKNNETGTTIKNGSTWKEQLHNSLNMLSQLVVVRHHDEDINPFLTPFYEALVKESIALNIQEAQWAAINQDAAIYQWALQQITQNIKAHFSSQASNTLLLLKQVEQLKQYPFDTKKITVGGALPLINQLIEHHESQHPTAHEEKQS